MLTPVISSSFVIFMGCDIYIFVMGVNDDGMRCDDRTGRMISQICDNHAFPP